MILFNSHFFSKKKTQVPLLFLMCIFSFNALASAESKSEKLRIAVEKILLDSGAKSITVKVVQGDEMWFESLGEDEVGSGKAPKEDSLLRVGSISKILSTNLLVKLSEMGKLHLSDPLQRFAPSNVKVPQLTNAEPITLLHLATHTSGLSRTAAVAMPANAAPFTWPNVQARWAWLQAYVPQLPPGKAALYSNVSYDFLADAISEAGKRPYVVLLRELVTAPLGMSDTTASPTADQCIRLLGKVTLQNVGECTDTSATAGSGGMYSTAKDMGLWMQSLLGLNTSSSSPVNSYTERTIAQAIYVQRDALDFATGLDWAGHANGIGLGWIYLAPTKNMPEILHKTGGGAGFYTYMALIPKRKLGVFVAVTELNIDNYSELVKAVNVLAADF